jgi:hypothetical protein
LAIWHPCKNNRRFAYFPLDSPSQICDIQSSKGRKQMTKYGRNYEGTRRYRVWVKGRKMDTETVMPADSKIQAQIRLANIWDVKSFEIECVWWKNWPRPQQ